MTLNSFDVVFYTIIFVIPGYIINYMYRYLFPYKTDNSPALIIRFLLFSMFNLSICAPIIYLIFNKNYMDKKPMIALVLYFVIIFIVPSIIGLVMGFIASRGWIRDFLQKIKINPIHSIPTSWDYRFSQSDICYLIIYLENGTTILGLYGKNSFASSVSGERDIYLEQLYKLGEDNQWEPVTSNNGVWISGSTIRQIEFIKGGD